jgi:hypothetical protein
LDNVFTARGFTNIQVIENFAAKAKEVHTREKAKLFEAAKVFGSKRGWERITENRFAEFLRIFENYCKANGIKRTNSDDAMEFALDYEEDFIDDDEIDELQQEDFSGDVSFNIPFREEKYIVSDMAGWSDSDTVDDFLNMPNFIEVTLIDFDGSIVYQGSDSKDFWDSFRELSDGNSFPIYDAYYVEDDDGNLFITAKVKGYY